MKLISLRALFVAQLSDLRDAEQRTLGVLTTLEHAAADERLRQVLRERRTTTRSHLDRIHGIFVTLGTTPNGTGMQSAKTLVDDCMTLARDADADSQVRDEAIIAAMRHFQHDEIDAYECASVWADALGEVEAAGCLRHSLSEVTGLERRLGMLAADANGRVVHAMAPT